MPRHEFTLHYQIDGSKPFLQRTEVNGLENPQKAQQSAGSMCKKVQVGEVFLLTRMPF